MNAILQPVTDALRQQFGAELKEFRDEVTLFVAPEDIVAACLLARDEYNFNMLIDATAVDYWPEADPRFHMVYQLYNMKDNVLLRLRVRLNGNAPVIATVSTVWPSANWKEREVYDLFGIRFEGHPDLRRIVMPHEWVGHPLRKDYPLGYEEVQFTFNVGDVDERKPYAHE